MAFIEVRISWLIRVRNSRSAFSAAGPRLAIHQGSPPPSSVGNVLMDAHRTDDVPLCIAFGNTTDQQPFVLLHPRGNGHFIRTGLSRIPHPGAIVHVLDLLAGETRPRPSSRSNLIPGTRQSQQNGSACTILSWVHFEDAQFHVGDDPHTDCISPATAHFPQQERKTFRILFVDGIGAHWGQQQGGLQKILPCRVHLRQTSTSIP